MQSLPGATRSALATAASTRRTVGTVTGLKRMWAMSGSSRKARGRSFARLLSPRCSSEHTTTSGHRPTRACCIKRSRNCCALSSPCMTLGMSSTRTRRRPAAPARTEPYRCARARKLRNCASADGACRQRGPPATLSKSHSCCWTGLTHSHTSAASSRASTETQAVFPAPAGPVRTRTRVPAPENAPSSTDRTSCTLFLRTASVAGVRGQCSRCHGESAGRAAVAAECAPAAGAGTPNTGVTHAADVRGRRGARGGRKRRVGRPAPPDIHRAPRAPGAERGTGSNCTRSLFYD